MSYDPAVEQMIIEKGLTSLRITSECVDLVIVDIDYHVFPKSLDTVCNITLENGFTVRGEAACVSSENFNVEMGQVISLKDAKKKVALLQAYLLKNAIYEREVIAKELGNDAHSAETVRLIKLSLEGHDEDMQDRFPQGVSA